MELLIWLVSCILAWTPSAFCKKFDWSMMKLPECNGGLKLSYAHYRNVSVWAIRSTMEFEISFSERICSTNHNISLILHNETYLFEKCYLWGLNCTYSTNYLSEKKCAKKVNVKIKAVKEMNMATLTVVDQTAGCQQALSPIILNYCQSTSLPTDLRQFGTKERLFRYNDTIGFTCTKGTLVNQNNVIKYILARCSRNASWIVPAGYECIEDCSFATLPSNLRPNQNNRRLLKSIAYSRNFRVQCALGRLYDANLHFSSTIMGNCSRNKTFRFPRYYCLYGAVVELRRPTVTVTADVQTTFVCDIIPSNSNNTYSLIIAGKNMTKLRKVPIWRQISLTWKFYGKEAICRKNLPSGEHKDKTMILLVKHPPHRLTTETTYGLARDLPGSVIIEFSAYPRIQPGNIVIRKNRTRLSNYFLEVNETINRVIIHFTKVDDSTFGIYRMVIRPPVFNKYIVVNFTIEAKSIKVLTIWHGIGIGSGTVFGFVMIVLSCVILVQLKRSKFSNKGDRISKGSIKSSPCSRGSTGPEYSPEDVGHQERHYVNTSSAGHTIQGDNSFYEIPLRQCPGYAETSFPTNSSRLNNGVNHESAYEPYSTMV